MCGRFVRAKNASEYAVVLGVKTVLELPLSYNVAPSQSILASRVVDGHRGGAGLFVRCEPG